MSDICYDTPLHTAAIPIKDCLPLNFHSSPSNSYINHAWFHPVHFHSATRTMALSYTLLSKLHWKPDYRSFSKLGIPQGFGLPPCNTHLQANWIIFLLWRILITLATNHLLLSASSWQKRYLLRFHIPENAHTFPKGSGKSILLLLPRYQPWPEPQNTQSFSSLRHLTMLFTELYNNWKESISYLIFLDDWSIHLKNQCFFWRRFFVFICS